MVPLRIVRAVAANQRKIVYQLDVKIALLWSELETHLQAGVITIWAEVQPRCGNNKLNEWISIWPFPNCSFVDHWRSTGLIEGIKRSLSKNFQMTKSLPWIHGYDRATGLMSLIHRVVAKFGTQDCNYIRTQIQKGCFLPCSLLPWQALKETSDTAGNNEPAVSIW